MASLHLILFLCILIGGSFAAQSDTCEAAKKSVKTLKDQVDLLCKKDDCLCNDSVDQFPFNTTTHNWEWWNKQKEALEKELGSSSGVTVTLLSPNKKSNCIWDASCVFSYGNTPPYRMTIIMGFFGKRPNYNATFPVNQIDWPEISCKGKTWTYRGYPIEFGGCLSENRK